MKNRTRQGGGVAIFTRSNIPCTRICEFEFDDVEWVWVKIRTQKATVLICCVYFPPNQSIIDLKNFLDKLTDCVTQAQTYTPSEIIILGDFNLGNVYLKPEHINHSGISNFDILFQDTMYGLNLTQLIRDPTRITERTANLRDLILVSDPQHVTEHGMLSPFSHIDHIPIFASLNFQTACHKPFVKSVWNYHQMNIDAFIHTFENKDWSVIYNMEIDDAITALTEFILDASSQCIPKRNITVKEKDKPWVSNVLKREIRKRNKLFQKARVSKEEEDWKKWRLQRNLVTCMNRKYKEKQYTHQVKRLSESKLNPYKYHQILKGMIGRKRSLPLPPLIDQNDQIHQTDVDKANLLNDYFASQSKETLTERIPLCSPDRDIPVLREIIITEEEVFNQLKVLNVNKATGPDGIPNKILKMVAIFLKEPLAKLFNKSLADGKYPSSWKHANIISVFKNKGSASDVKSYRPISLLSSMSKNFRKNCI